eukprot:CAMPEP_0171323164 /NCGR_PEP_ID=MMETSP0816-20121228/115404_1 /TAXON_ID=420281 /ORGANISM="Proboscia inermis, Strain CCAP1064/1" /LENGTH=71 /DNA_ID=CAMNT_0011821811 /DNA_START=692 /DNA_END=907 /DNA_ORIENTATION=-
MSIALRCYNEDYLKKKEQKDARTNGDMFQLWFELEQVKKSILSFPRSYLPFVIRYEADGPFYPICLNRTSG